MKRSTLVIVVMTLVAVAAIVALIAWKEALDQRLGVEGYKQILQFSLITVIGGLVSVLYGEFKREQEQRALYRAHLLGFYNGLLGQYNKSKKLRRLLRALVAKSSVLSAADCEARYTELLMQLEEVQLEFESCRRQVEVQGRVFPQHDFIVPLLETMQHSLRGVVREYEDGKFAHCGSISFTDLPHLRQYLVETADGGTFVAEVSRPFERIEGALLAEL
ncbi:hypothetical protein, partial [Steroidobacter sp.]|uniref:hypothetical protein n=1 Tax=Steroidobacter sp. TaxID=1978227 RepID=UPI001A5A028C